MVSGGSVPYWGSRISKPTESRVAGMESTNFPSGSLGDGKMGHSCFCLLVLRPLYFIYWDLNPYKGLSPIVRTVSWRMAYHPCKVPLLSWRFNYASNKLLHNTLSGRQLLDGAVCDMISGLYSHGLTPSLP